MEVGMYNFQMNIVVGRIKYRFLSFLTHSSIYLYITYIYMFTKTNKQKKNINLFLNKTSDELFIPLIKNIT